MPEWNDGGRDLLWTISSADWKKLGERAMPPT